MFLLGGFLGGFCWWNVVWCFEAFRVSLKLGNWYEFGVIFVAMKGRF